MWGLFVASIPAMTWNPPCFMVTGSGSTFCTLCARQRPPLNLEAPPTSNCQNHHKSTSTSHFLYLLLWIDHFLLRGPRLTQISTKEVANLRLPNTPHQKYLLYVFQYGLCIYHVCVFSLYKALSTRISAGQNAQGKIHYDEKSGCLACGPFEKCEATVAGALLT